MEIKSKLKAVNKFNDLIDVVNYTDVCKMSSNKIKKLGTDFYFMLSGAHKNFIKRSYAPYFVKDNDPPIITSFIDKSGDLMVKRMNNTIGICPKISIDIPNEVEADEFKIEYYKKSNILNLFGKKHAIYLGTYPQKLVDEKKTMLLESMFNSGNLNKELKPTGKTYTFPQVYSNVDVYETICSEFEYNGKKFIRTNAPTSTNKNSFAWFEVDKVPFVIKNWKDMPKYINKNGTGKATEMKLESDIVLLCGLNEEVDRHFSDYLNKKLLPELLDFKDKSKTVLKIDSVSGIRAVDVENCVNYDTVICSGRYDFDEGKYAYNAHRYFKNCNFKYIYQNGINGDIYLSKFPPKDATLVLNLVDVEKFKKAFDGIAYGHILSLLNIKNKKDFEDINKLCQKLNKANISVPFNYMDILIKRGQLTNFAESDFRFFKNEISNLDTLLRSADLDKKCAFFEFARFLGCFSNEKWLDKNGAETNILKAQKSSSLLNQILNTKSLDIKQMPYLLAGFGLINRNLISKKTASQDLIKFLSIKGEKGKFDNLEMIKKMEVEKRGSFLNALRNFEMAKKMRVTIGPNGKNKVVPWKEVFNNLIEELIYEHVDEDNFDLAQEFKLHNISQNDFDFASALFEEARNKNVKSHILNVPLKENTAKTDAENLKIVIGNELGNSLSILDDTYKNVFSYEMLDKHDPKNAVMGLYCDCCATLFSSVYGSDIAKATIVEHDVQNLVVRDAKGDIIAKADMYVNKEKGYVVINEFDLNAKYKKDEGKDGYYTSSEFSEASKDREAIFQTIMRGLKAFVEEYDKENPEMPIKKVTVGMDLNRLKLQCKRYKSARPVLKVPNEYRFLDAMDEQRVLYTRQKGVLKEALNELDK